MSRKFGMDLPSKHKMFIIYFRKSSKSYVHIQLYIIANYKGHNISCTTLCKKSDDVHNSPFQLIWNYFLLNPKHPPRLPLIFQGKTGQKWWQQHKTFSLHFHQVDNVVVDNVVSFSFTERKWKHPKVMPVATLEAFCFNMSMPQFSYFKKRS